MNRRAMAAETSTLSPRANSAIAASSPVTLASAVARKVYGLDSVTSTAYGAEDASAGRNVWSTDDGPLLRLARPRLGLERACQDGAVRRPARSRLALALRRPTSRT